MKSDSIHFVVSAEEVVVNTTVKINATVAAIVTPDITENVLKDSIRAMMRAFIPTDVADWQFSGMNRTSHVSGMEQITLSATARVPETQNYALDRRKEEVSRDGLRIVSINTDTSPTSGQIEQTQSKLRLELLGKACKEQAAINEALNESYRLGKVVFDPDLESAVSNRRGSKVMAMAASTYGTGFDGGSGEIGNAVKLTMQASVTLRI